MEAYPQELQKQQFKKYHLHSQKDMGLGMNYFKLNKGKTKKMVLHIESGFTFYIKNRFLFLFY